MPSPAARLAAAAVASFWPAAAQDNVAYHTLSPTYFLPRAAAVEPEAVAVVHDKNAAGKRVVRTYAEVARRASGLAYFLKHQGLGRTGILCPNTPAFLESIFGVNGAGGVVVPVNYRLKAEDLAYIFTHAQVDSIIVDAEHVQLLNELLKKAPHVRLLVDYDTDGKQLGRTHTDAHGQTHISYDSAVDEGWAVDAHSGGRGWAGLEIQCRDENGTIALAYTSGTTARPKGVEYTHRGAYLAALANVVESNLGGSRAGYLWTLPMFHALGWTFPWAVTAARGTHYCLRKVDYPQIWHLLKTEPITNFAAAPTVNTLLCADPGAERLDRAVGVTVAASPPTAALFKQMTALNLHPVHVYGLTETYGPITVGYHMDSWKQLPDAERFELMARQGHGFVTSQAVRVIKTADGVSVQDVARDGKEVGEIVFQGNICCKGYYRDAAATRKLFAGGVLHSGDLALWHRDGSIQIVDRDKDIIISGGENISSVSVESVLVHHDAVLEVAVVGVADAKWGEIPVAYVTLKGNKDGADLPGALIQWAKRDGRLAGFMVPKAVHVVAELPKTATGKVRKNVLREWAKGGGSDASAGGGPKAKL